MRAAVLASLLDRPLRIEEVSRPQPGVGQVLLPCWRVGFAGPTSTLVEGEFSPLRTSLIPGHQIVGEIVKGATPELPLRARVGVSWIGGTDGACWYCNNNLENLCDSPTFAGYSVNGGYAEFAVARSDFVFPLPAALDNVRGVPLLCAASSGFAACASPVRNRPKESGCLAFGASAHLAIEVLRAWRC
jgi:alcohol dehydrogenase, propanol-preferring